MNSTSTSEPTAPLGDTTSPAAIARPLSQRVGGVEAPAAGRWLLHRTSSIMVTSARRPRALHARDGWLDVATLPDMAALAIAADSGDTSVSLLAVACEMAANDAGTWTLVGRVTDGGTAHDITLDLTYHGVYRHGDTGYVRLTGKVATPVVRRLGRRTTALELTIDLLFTAPAATAANDDTTAAIAA